MHQPPRYAPRFPPLRLVQHLPSDLAMRSVNVFARAGVGQPLTLWDIREPDLTARKQPLGAFLEHCREILQDRRGHAVEWNCGNELAASDASRSSRIGREPLRTFQRLRRADNLPARRARVRGTVLGAARGWLLLGRLRCLVPH